MPRRHEPIEAPREPIARTIDSDPAEQGALGVPKELEPVGDPEGLHAEGDIDEMLDRQSRHEDDATVHRFEHEHRDDGIDPQSPEDLAADAIALATQGGGSLMEDDDPGGLEEHVDRDALVAGIVPQLVSQASLDAAALPDAGAEEEPEEEDTIATPRPVTPKRARTRTAARGARKPRAH